MFKLTVEQVLASIAILTDEEKMNLKSHLTTVLAASSTATESLNGQTQTNSVNGINFGNGGGSNNFNFAPVQAGGNATSSTNLTQRAIQNPDLQEVLSLLAQLKQDIVQNLDLNPLVKNGAQEQVEQLAQELKKPEPNKTLVRKTIDNLKQGLEEVLALAEPTAKIASLVAKLLGIVLL